MINGYNYDVWRRNRRFLKRIYIYIYTKISSLGFNEDRPRNKAQLCTTCNATETKIWRPADKKNRSKEVQKKLKISKVIHFSKFFFMFVVASSEKV